MKILLLLAAAGLLYILQDLIYKTFWDKNLSVSIHFQDKAVLEGEQATLTEVIENRKLLPLAYLNVKFQVSRNLVFQNMENCFTREYEERLSSPVKSADTMRLHNLISSHPIYL